MIEVRIARFRCRSCCYYYNAVDSSHHRHPLQPNHTLSSSSAGQIDFQCEEQRVNQSDMRFCIVGAFGGWMVITRYEAEGPIASLRYYCYCNVNQWRCLRDYLCPQSGLRVGAMTGRWLLLGLMDECSFFLL